jgi:hypothetical protein
VLHRVKSRARFAAMLGVRDHGTGASLGTGSAGPGAVSPVAPFRDGALAGTRVDFALCLVDEVRAGGTTVGVEVNEFTGALLGASAAALGAATEGGPITKFAINRAEVLVAVPVLVTVGAFSTTMVSSSIGPFSGLGARAAREGACTPFAPGAVDAINSTVVAVACAGVFHGRAGNTAPLGRRLSASTRLEVD